MAIRLSILIATMPKRKWKFNRVLNILDSQLPMNGCVEILWDDSMQYNIGIKRNKLLERACGDYIVYIDDDDLISKDYVKLILQATEGDPDCIGISGIITTNGKDEKQWHISKEYGTWWEKNGIYYRTPNHISPVKREIAMKIRFPEISYGEDAVYSRNIHPHLKTENIVTSNIYTYKYSNKKK